MIFSKIEAAKNLGISAITLDRHRKKGNISYKKIGARIMFTDTDISDFINRCSIPAREGSVA